MQIALILDDRIIGQQDHSTAYQQMTYQTEFKGIAKDALEDLIVASNPRPVKTEQEVIDLLKEAY